MRRASKSKGIMTANEEQICPRWGKSMLVISFIPKSLVKQLLHRTGRNVHTLVYKWK